MMIDEQPTVKWLEYSIWMDGESTDLIYELVVLVLQINSHTKIHILIYCCFQLLVYYQWIIRL